MFPDATTVVRAPVKVVLPLLPIPVVLAGDPMPPDATTEIRPATLSGDPPIVSVDGKTQPIKHEKKVLKSLVQQQQRQTRLRICSSAPVYRVDRELLTLATVWWFVDFDRNRLQTSTERAHPTDSHFSRKALLGGTRHQGVFRTVGENPIRLTSPPVARHRDE